jgi:hypothetical protein
MKLHDLSFPAEGHRGRASGFSRVFDDQYHFAAITIFILDFRFLILD